MNKNEILILYTTNAWHDFESRILLGCFTDWNTLLIYCTNFLDRDDMHMLKKQSQTQGKAQNYEVVTYQINPSYD